MGSIGNTQLSLDVATSEALARLIAVLGERPPAAMATAESLRDRQRFLTDSLGDSREAERVFERVIAGDELQPVAYLERGAIAARAVARVAIGGAGSGRYGTGFLIAPRVLITNNHVLPDAAIAAGSLAQFAYETDLEGTPIGPVDFNLAPDDLFHTNAAMDFTIVAVRPRGLDGRAVLEGFGHLPLLAESGKAAEGEWLSIIQHPGGGRKQVCVRENKLIRRKPDVLWYTTDTKPGSSGSPVFSNDWYVVALHHAGVPATRNGVTQTLDGRDFDHHSMDEDQIKWIGNEGIRASRIHETLLQSLPGHPLLKAFFAASPSSARIGHSNLTGAAAPKPPAAAMPPPPPHTSARPAMSTSRSMTIPVEITLTLRGDAPGSDGTAVFSVGGGAVESTLLAEARKAREPAFDAPFDPDYGKRKGFDEKFLGTGENIVPLPVLGPQNEESVARLLTPTTGNKYVLHYENFSVAMNAARRLAFYSAANVSFGQRYEMSRSRDVWRRDPRILAAHQLEGFYYVRNKFDRGHLTRREDLEFGATPQDALASAGDTCHFTNCAPQHERFNQNREIWQGIERYILEESIREGRFNAQIITGPIFDEGDPEYQEIQYPLQFWKVVAGLKPDGKLFASAYLASQDAVIDQYGIEAVGAPLGAYKTFQISIAEIERLTGLSFPCGVGGKKALRDADVLARPASRRRRRAQGRHESSGGAGTASGYHEIRSLEDIAF